MNEVDSNKNSLDKFGEELADQTGITPAEIKNADEAQGAVLATINNAIDFVLPTVNAGREADRQNNAGIIIPPYTEEELGNARNLIEQSGVQIAMEFASHNELHALSAILFGLSLGIEDEEIEGIIKSSVPENPLSKDTVSSKDLSYNLEEVIVMKLGRLYDLETPDSLAPSGERREFMTKLARSLEDSHKAELARYIASTAGEYQQTPFEPWDFFSPRGNRQFLAIALSPQIINKDEIAGFLGSNPTWQDANLMLAANPMIRKYLPFTSSLAAEYRCDIRTHGDDITGLSLGELVELGIAKSYDGDSGYAYISKPRGLLPFEELGGLAIASNLKKTEPGTLGEELKILVPKMLSASDPQSVLLKAYPDLSFYKYGDINEIGGDLVALRQAIESPGVVPPRDFWSRLHPVENGLTSTDRIKRVLNQLVNDAYSSEGEKHREAWKEVTNAFRNHEARRNDKDPITVVVGPHGQYHIRGNDGLSFTLIPDSEEGWIPTPYYDSSSRISEFSIAGQSYDDLASMIADRPLKYEILPEYLSNVLRERLVGLSNQVYEALNNQVDLDAIVQRGLDVSHSSLAYSRGGPGLNYLIGNLIPQGVGKYESILYSMLGKLHEHDKLPVTRQPVPVDLTGEEITLEHPLLATKDMSYDEILAGLQEIGIDVRIPEITIRKKGAELRAKAWVYDAIQVLKELGFDSILGETMAEEFNVQASRLFVRNSLTELKFIGEEVKPEAPLIELKQRQQLLYTRALSHGFDDRGNLHEYLLHPLTLAREKQLINYLEEKLTDEELSEIYERSGIKPESNDMRELSEKFMNFASGWGCTEFDRSDEFPVRVVTKSQGWGNLTRGGIPGLGFMKGENAVSTQAQERFKAAKKSWEEFLLEVRLDKSSMVGDLSDAELDPILNLGDQLVHRISEMSEGTVTDWAEKIIKGEIASVGRDINSAMLVRTWAEFDAAVERVMGTAKLVLTYRAKEQRFGWEVSTDSKEI